MNTYHFINDSQFVLSTLTIEEFLTSLPLVIAFKSSKAFEKSHFDLLLPNKLQITRGGQKHFCKVGLITFKEKYKETRTRGDQCFKCFEKGNISSEFSHKRIMLIKDQHIGSLNDSHSSPSEVFFFKLFRQNNFSKGKSFRKYRKALLICSLL